MKIICFYLIFMINTVDIDFSLFAYEVLFPVHEVIMQ